MITFRESAARMAERLRVMKKLQMMHKEFGDEDVLLPVQDLFNAGDQVALDLYEKELAQATGARELPFAQVGESI
jgi:hypothetical protein